MRRTKLWRTSMVAKKQQKAPSLNEGAETSDPAGVTRRLAPEIRERQILLKAVEHFATHGFSGSTRELARQIGVTQPLLYRYFPSKEVLIVRQIKDRSVPIQERMVKFYTAYAGVILRREWIRIFIFAGLTREGINTKYLGRLREQIFLPIMEEVRNAYDLPPPADAKERESDQELIWSLHASIFYLGVRKWIYGLAVSEDLDANISRQIDAFLNGVPKAMKKAATRPVKAAKRQSA
jgi:AcrR family transcriptional regulator